MPYPPYVHQAYPSVRYHATLPPVTVADPSADDALGEGWADSPAAFEAAPEPEAAPEAATQEDASDATPVTPEPAAAPAKRRR